MIQIAICDDETGTCTQIEDMVKAFAKSRAFAAETEVFYSGETLYRAMQDTCPFDLIFLDILLLDLDGIQLGRLIREQLHNEAVSIVYISSKETFAMRLFQVRPLDFLIKPVTQEHVSAILEKFIYLYAVNKKVFCFRRGKAVCRVYFDDILYFACSGKKVEIHTRLQQNTFYGTMRDVLEQVQGAGFWTIHKSYIVNSTYVSIYNYDSIKLTDGTILPISQKYRKIMRENLTSLLHAETGGRKTVL